ncbi:PH domain-containing protein [Nonomuraea sp. NPDC048916]|uniref:PH domain-containing protein n=1 Tax=Nonomuraea sp. NPDC048916 TaxID=3154232 RepID=UPI0033E31AEC
MKQTYRSRFAFVLGWVWVAFVAVNTVDLIVRFNGKPALVALAVLMVLTAGVYMSGLRPATVLAEDGLLARNPLRTTFVPWASVKEVTVSHSINVHLGDDRILRLWTPVSTARERAKARRRVGARPQRGRFQTEPTLSKGEQAAAEALAGKTHADWLGEQITERAESAGRRGDQAAPVRVSWAIDSFAILAVAIALLVAAIVID